MMEAERAPARATASSPMAAAPPPGQKLDVLQAGRAFAALLVVLFHLNGAIFGQGAHFGPEFSPILRFGYAGVQFFFVLSGFIIAHIHWQDIGRPERLPRYAWKRFARIYPVYWVVLALMIPVLLMVPSFGPPTAREPVHIVTSILLIPMPENPILDVAWTLRHEVLFYAVFGLLLLNRRLGMLVAGIGLAGTLAWMLTGSEAFPGRFFFSAANLLFLMGIAAAWLVRRPVRAPWLLLVLGVGLFLATGLRDAVFGGAGPYLRLLGFGLGSMLGIIGAVALESSGRLTVHRVWARLGDASYSLYLIHMPVLSAEAKIMTLTGAAEVLPRWLSFAIMLATTVLIAQVFHILVERTLLKLLTRRPAKAVPASSLP
jgi:exopolysaccharide production protein ExoZ